MDKTAYYKITVQGCLDRSWSRSLGGISIQVQTPTDEAPVTVLTGSFRDQAALAGVINTLYDLGFPLRLIEYLDPKLEENTQENGYLDQSSGLSQTGGATTE